MIKISGFVFGLFVLILGYQLFQGQKPADQTLMEVQEIPSQQTDVRACETDSDCIPIAESCCDCDQGGRRIAINRKYYKHGLENRADSCLLAICQEAESTHMSCTGAEPTCVSGQCQMR